MEEWLGGKCPVDSGSPGSQVSWQTPHHPTHRGMTQFLQMDSDAASVAVFLSVSDEESEYWHPPDSCFKLQL